MSRSRRGDGPPLPALGPRNGVPRLAASIDWSVLYLDDIKGFVLSRIDGRTTLGEIVLLTPFPESQTVAILTELFARGIIDLPGVPRPLRQSLPGSEEAPPPEPEPEPLPQKPAAKPAGEAVARELTPELKHRIDDLFGLVVDDPTPEVAARLLGVEPGVDKKTLKRAFFALSKEFHPDRYFRKNLGEYERKLQRVFAAIKTAYESLDGTARK